MWEARQDGLIVTRIAQETLVYDQTRQELHHLDALSAIVWDHVDHLPATDVILKLAQEQIDPQISNVDIDLALAALARANLLQGPALPVTSNRRRLLRTASMGAVVIPAVVSISAPLAAAAASTCTSLPANRYMDLRFRRNESGQCNVIVFVANYCPNRDYPVSVSVRVQGGEIYQTWDTVVSTDGEGYGSVQVTTWPEITAWLFSTTVGDSFYGPVSSYCPS